MSETSSSITRRELLKRGALVGVATLWVTPIVQTVGMGRAFAQVTSEQCLYYCIVWQPSEPGAPSNWAVSEGDKCLPCRADTVAELPPNIDEFTVVYDDASRTYTVTYPNTYKLALEPGDPSPDDLVNASGAALRRGENVNSCEFEFVAVDDPFPPNTTQIQFTDWDAASGDRIELVLKSCV